MGDHNTQVSLSVSHQLLFTGLQLADELDGVTTMQNWLWPLLVQEGKSERSGRA